MAFADLKNDFVFRRIFATHPDILRGLLNDLLERTGDRTIEAIEYLPSEQLPLVVGAKLSILDVRCKDRAGTRFVVEMQLIHVPGFVNRVVYNACKAYADQLQAGEPYTVLTDVVAISICDFELWPDARQDEQKLPRVPMLSRWNMTEHSSGNHGLLQVQYAFLELPKLPEHKPDTGLLHWAWLFVHAPELTEVPADLPPGPHREALALANAATFSLTELDAYRKVMDEIQQAREYGEAKRVEGKLEGKAEGKAEALLAVLAARGIAAAGEARARIEACRDVATLDRWITRAVTADSVEEVLSAAPPRPDRRRATRWIQAPPLAPHPTPRQGWRMAFADLKNDFVFRRIFATHPDILRGLLNDLLERTGDRTIEAIEYLPSEQLPLVVGAKLSILDVRCKDRAGTRFVVEMQLIHVPGFVNRVVYNACKAYADQLQAGEPYTVLTDVVAISICDFELWPDARQDEQKLPRVPMLSRWNMTEHSSGNHGLLQVQYAFLELPKLPEHKPDTGLLHWAWLFVHAPELTEVPADLPPGPHREALALANAATFSLTELDAYRKVMDEIQQAREYGEVKRVEGKLEGKAEALLAVLAARGIAAAGEARARIEACRDVATLDRWITRAVTADSVEEVLSAAPPRA